MKGPDGGPAYPSQSFGLRQDSEQPYLEPYTFDSGMSLRDYFAGLALTGLIAMPWHPEMGWAPGIDTNEKLAKRAYQIADAMIAAREANDA